MNPTLERALQTLPAGARILDAGGWFKPCPMATDVVDLMRYETRGAALQPFALPGEKFTKATWRQVNFLDDNLRLPYPDRAFDFCICTHTIEDLSDPAPLLRELQRVARAGLIECPSRLTEQTVGIRDRTTSAQGHPHHHWIVDASDRMLELASKANSLAGPAREHAIPLRLCEAALARDSSAANTALLWHGSLSWRILSSIEARQRAREFRVRLQVTAGMDLGDAVVRRLRRCKYRLLHPASTSPEDWWGAMLRLSRPYSAIPL